MTKLHSFVHVLFCSSSSVLGQACCTGGDWFLLRLLSGTMVQRLTYRRRHCYATKSNRVRVVKTPGGRLTYQYQKKPTSTPKCGATGVKLQGLKQIRPAKLSNKHLSKKNKTVHRVYGGCLDHKVVRERIIRAFLIEEQKIVKKVMKMKAKGGKADK